MDRRGLGHLARNARVRGTVSMRARLVGRPMPPGRPGAAQPAQFLTRALDLVQDAAAMRQQQAPASVGTGAAAVARQQVLPQLDFEQADLAAQRRLGHSQRRRGAGEAAEFGHADKVFDLLEVHAHRSADLLAM
jgi:hypothetical protein